MAAEWFSFAEASQLQAQRAKYCRRIGSQLLVI